MLLWGWMVSDIKTECKLKATLWRCRHNYVYVWLIRYIMMYLFNNLKNLGRWHKVHSSGLRWKKRTYLCRHQISCTCWDYSEGHLCKHCHKVRAVSSGACSDANDCSGAEDPISSSFAFNPESCSGGKAGLISRSKVQTAFYVFNSGRMIYS